MQSSDSTLLSCYWLNRCTLTRRSSQRLAGGSIARTHIGVNFGKLFSTLLSLVTRSLYANLNALYWMGLKVRVRGG